MLIRKKIGDLLLEAGLIDEDQLRQALNEQSKSNSRLGEILIQKNFITESQMMQVLQDQLGIPFIDLKQAELEKKALNSIPSRLAEQLKVIPVKFENGNMIVAMTDPLDFAAIEELRLMCGFSIVPYLTTKDDLRKAISHYYYGDPMSGMTPAEQLQVPVHEEQSYEFDFESTELHDAAKLIIKLFSKAFQKDADGLYFAPLADEVKVSLRIGDKLVPDESLSLSTYKFVATKLKSMSHSASGDKLFQHGSFSLDYQSSSVDVAVAIFHTVNGEHIVANWNGGELKPGSTGSLLKPEILQDLEASSAVTLVTGAAGSGKSSFLQAYVRKSIQNKLNVLCLTDHKMKSHDGSMHLVIDASQPFPDVLFWARQCNPDIVIIDELTSREAAEQAFLLAAEGYKVVAAIRAMHSAALVLKLLHMGIARAWLQGLLSGIVDVKRVREQSLQKMMLNPFLNTGALVTVEELLELCVKQTVLPMEEEAARTGSFQTEFSYFE